MERWWQKSVFVFRFDFIFGMLSDARFFKVLLKATICLVLIERFVVAINAAFWIQASLLQHSHHQAHHAFQKKYSHSKYYFILFIFPVVLCNFLMNYLQIKTTPKKWKNKIELPWQNISRVCGKIDDETSMKCLGQPDSYNDSNNKMLN